MVKNINFLCGLPRSGSTLLATLLNQHPKIYASPHSALLDGLYAMREAFVNSESVRFNLRTSAYQTTLWNVPQIFYQDIEKEIIFDKQFCWSTSDNLELASKISIYPRFIVCYRPVLEILVSFVSKASENPNFYLNRRLDESYFFSKEYLSRNDAMAEYLMNGHELLPKALAGLQNAKKNEESGIFKFVNYHNLVDNTQQEMNSIFEFMMLEPAKIQTAHIENIFRYNDQAVVGIEGFHHVRNKLEKQSPRPEDYFSDFILQKYANALTPFGL